MVITGAPGATAAPEEAGAAAFTGAVVVLGGGALGAPGALVCRPDPPVTGVWAGVGTCAVAENPSKKDSAIKQNLFFIDVE